MCYVIFCKEHHFVENNQLMITDDDFVTFRCNNVTIHNVTSAGTEVVILKNPGQHRAVPLAPGTIHSQNKELKKSVGIFSVMSWQ